MRDRREVGDGLSDQAADVDALGLEGARLVGDAHRLDEPVDDVDETVGLVAHDLDVLADVVVDLAGDAVQDVLRCAADGGEGRPQVVGDVLNRLLAVLGDLVERDLRARQRDVGAAQLHPALHHLALELEVPFVELAHASLQLGEAPLEIPGVGRRAHGRLYARMLTLLTRNFLAAFSVDSWVKA